LVLAESAILLDLLVPGEVGLVVAGAAAADNGTPLLVVIVAATFGALGGDTLGYAIGRRFGEDLVDHWAWTRRRLGPGLEKARAHYERRGGLSVAVARWVGALRAVVPVIAGSSGLPLRQLLAWDAPSSLAWAAAVASVGFVWGDDAAELVDRVGLAVSLAVVAAIVLIAWLLRRRSSGKAEAPA
jgi:undecaprenyl-diphosphatase